MILDSWIEKSIECFVVARESDNEAVGFCTMSISEVCDIPSYYIEQCHLVVDPQHNYFRIGARLCRAAAQAASRRGYKFGCARIVPTNLYALALARSLRATEITGDEVWTPAGFRWFRLAI